MDSTKTLATFAVETPINRIPGWTLHEAKRCFINYLAVSLYATFSTPASILAEWLQEEGGTPQATVIGRGLRTSLRNTSLLNGYLAHLEDYDDTHFPTVIHPSAVVWPAVFAIAESRKLSGADALVAFVLGVEACCRVSLSVHPWHYDQGWHITSTAGVFGSVVGAGRLFGLSVPQMTHALGIAGTQALGLRGSFGTMAKAYHPGRAASAGLESAVLAAKGFTGAETILEGRRGFWEVMSSAGHDESAISDALGERWELKNNGLKPYSCGVVSHPLQDAVISLRNAHNIQPGQVQAIHARTHPLVLELINRPEAKTGLEGKFSFQHSVAAALVDGAGYPSQYTDERVADPTIVGVRSKVTATSDTSLGEDETYLTITLTDGRTLEQHVAHATGSPSNPMTDEALETKFRTLAAAVLPEDQAERLLQAAWAMDTAPNLDELAKLAISPQAK
ncbi:MAG: MmgE/PrpD family protein [Chloroflexi bacterium]|nr:MmgE/PrpD family protein [Chloroflexota bacterium]